MSLYTNDIDNIGEALNNSFTNIISSTLTFTGNIIMMIVLSPIMFIITITFLALMMFLVKKVGAKSGYYFGMQQKNIGKLNGYVEEIISGQKTIKVYHQEETMLHRFDERNIDAVDAYYDADYYGSMTGPSVNFINNLSLTLISVFGALLYLVGGILIMKYRSDLSVGDITVLVALLGITMCNVFHKAEHLAHHHVKNPWIRIAVGGLLVMGLTLLVGDHRFNGAGMDMALEAVQGHADWYSFLLKLLFTAVTLAAGFKGGEIVPTFCIGATFGCVVGGLLGLDAGICGALGLIGLFCCATNSPLASIVLSIEMFGGANLHLFALICVICFVLSGNTGLYSSQMHIFGKTSTNPLPKDSI